MLTLLAEAIPTGVTESTTLGTLGPTIFVLTLAIGLVGGVIGMYMKMRSSLKEGIHEFIESKQGEKLIEESFWTFVKTEGYGTWVKNKVETHTSGQMGALLNQMEQLTQSVGQLTTKVEKLVDKLESQSEEMKELERRFMEEKIERVKQRS